MLSQIVDMVAKAQRSRAPSQKLADQVASWFVPAVLAIALITFVAWMIAGPATNLNRALSCSVAVLIIACPCALGLATPMAITVGMGRGARAGILFRDADSIEQLGRIDLLFIDKTGTLTIGAPVVAALSTSPGFSEDDLLTAAASTEQHSEHPLARAIVNAAQARNLPRKPADDFRVEPGQGVSAKIDGRLVHVGRQLAATSNLNSSTSTMTTSIVTIDGQIMGEIGFTDSVRETAKQGLDDLRHMDVHVKIVTGDRKAAAHPIAASLGIPDSDLFTDVTPNDKLRILQEARTSGHRVAMAGDGMNDAPALAEADVGISLGTGTDIAKESAGVILVQPDLEGIGRAIQLSRAVNVVIRQNLAFAFGYNLIGIPIAAGVLAPIWGITLNPMFAAVAMSFSSVSVIANALRLRTIRIER
jgi:Cu+-exporting ATPase